MKLRPREYDDDDGRVIINMDVDGMPWHDRKVRRERHETRKFGRSGQFTRSESRLYTWYSLLAGFLIASVFSLTWILFILFCTQIWFR